MDKNFCETELQKYQDIIGNSFTYISDSYTITILDLECKSIQNPEHSFYIRVKYKRNDNDTIDYTSIDNFKTYYR